MRVDFFLVQGKIVELVFCGLHLLLTCHKLLNWRLCATLEPEHASRTGKLKKIRFLGRVQLKTFLLGQYAQLRQVNLV